MSTKLQQFLATSPWAQRLLLAIIAIIWAQHCSKWGPGVLDSTFKNLNPPFSDLDFLLTFAILQVTATAYFIYRGRHADLVMIHVTEQACSLIISSTNGRNARLKLSQLLSDLLLRISAAIGAMRFAANLNLLKTVAWIEFFKELSTLKLISLDSRISPDTSRLYLKYVNWDITFQVFYLLLCPVVAIKIRRSLEHTYVIMRLPRLLLVVAVVLWAICRESGLSHVRCFRLMFFELFFQSTGIFWVIWAPCDALARRSYVSRVQDINKDEGTASTQCSNREQLARRRCDQRNQLLTELRKSTSPIGLLFAINHKSEGIRFEEACKRRADANNIQFQSFDKLQPEEQCKVDNLFKLPLSSRVLWVMPMSRKRADPYRSSNRYSKGLYDQTKPLRESHSSLAWYRGDCLSGQ